MKQDPYADAPRLPDADRVDPRSLLNASGNPVELEIGPGRGWFMVERLESQPEVRMLGLEIRRKWATIVDRRLASRGLGGRSRVFAEDVRHALPRFPDASLSRVFVNFPDPWWKKKHRKRLVFTDELARELARTLCPGGDLFVQTDVEERALAYEGVVERTPMFAPVAGGARVDANPWGAQSPRERRVLADGLPVFRLHYVRI